MSTPMYEAKTWSSTLEFGAPTRAPNVSFSRGTDRELVAYH
jgi:hypothetical protein